MITAYSDTTFHNKKKKKKKKKIQKKKPNGTKLNIMTFEKFYMNANFLYFNIIFCDLFKHKDANYVLHNLLTYIAHMFCLYPEVQTSAVAELRLT